MACNSFLKKSTVRILLCIVMLHRKKVIVSAIMSSLNMYQHWYFLFTLFLLILDETIRLEWNYQTVTWDKLLTLLHLSFFTASLQKWMRWGKVSEPQVLKLCQFPLSHNMLLTFCRDYPHTMLYKNFKTSMHPKNENKPTHNLRDGYQLLFTGHTSLTRGAAFSSFHHRTLLGPQHLLRLSQEKKPS